MTGLTHPANAYRMLRITDGKSQGRLALDADVQPWSTLQSDGAPLPLMLSPQAAQGGRYLIYREPLRNYPNRTIHAWIGHWIYGDVPLYGLFKMQLWFGLAAFVLQLPFSIRKNIARIRQLRYGRRLKGPVLVNAKGFTKAVTGDGIGITTNDSKRPLRIPRDAENKHFLIVGDTGSGKSSIIRQMLYQVDTRGDSAIVYDPACEFVKQFYVTMRSMMAKLKLTVNENKTRVCKLPEEKFDFLGYSFGRCYSPKTGRAYPQSSTAVSLQASRFPIRIPTRI